MLEHILKSFLVSTPNVDHELQVEHKETKRVALVVYSSNSSLCGGFNSNVIKMMMHAVDEYKAQGIDDITVYPIGRKVAEKAQKLGLKIGGNFMDLADHPNAQRLCRHRPVTCQAVCCWRTRQGGDDLSSLQECRFADSDPENFPAYRPQY